MLLPPERLAAFLPGVCAAEADVLERVVVQRQQGTALPMPLGPRLDGQEQVQEVRLTCRLNRNPPPRAVLQVGGLG